MEISESAIMSSIYWSFITIGRLIVIPIFLKFNTKYLILINSYGSIFSMLISLILINTEYI